MGIKPTVDRSDPRIQRGQRAVIAMAAAHVAMEDLFPVDPIAAAIRTGQVAATWVGDVLVVSAHGGCADDLRALLVAAALAEPERAL